MIRLTRNQIREVDRRSIEEFHIPGIVLMENAARAATSVACDMSREKDRVLILCGGGNNGGDGLAVARLLHNAGREVMIALTIDPAKYRGDALINWQIVQAMKLPTRAFEAEMISREKPALIVDAIFGTGLSSPPREPFDKIVQAVNESGIPVLAIDVPSGLDCDTGLPLGNCIIATRTVTFVAKKIGFGQSEARKFLGSVTVGDIGCPKELLKAV